MVDGRVAVGVRFTTRTVTELEDPNLREPAVGVRNYQEPGAGRLQETLAWGWEGAGTSDGQPGDFHAVYALDNGLLENRRQPPVLDGVIAGLARYDYDANGHYVTEGLGVRFLSTDTDAQEHIFSVPRDGPTSTASRSNAANRNACVCPSTRIFPQTGEQMNTIKHLYRYPKNNDGGKAEP
jgi:hypothetical protein